jgi:hypothetical protein
MALTKLQLRPGIVRETTDFTNQGGWFDGDKIRFRLGMPESIGGWTKLTNSTLLGACRDLRLWASLTGDTYIGAGTNLKLYVVEGSLPWDITPIRLTTTGTATFDATTGSTAIIVTDANNLVIRNDFVTFSDAVSLGGNITAEILNQEYQVTGVIDGDNYTITASVAATSGDTGDGGSSTIAAYQINTGLDTVVLGSGWGAGVYGRGTWNSAANTSIAGSQLTLWSQSNFGEDLLANVRGGGIYYWDASNGLNFRAVNITSLDAANEFTPVIANQILVSERSRHVIAFGCNPEYGPDGLPTTVQDPLVLRFSSQESLTDWQSLPTNSAGELRLSNGTQIVGAIQTKQQIIVFTDTSVFAMQYLGPPYTFGINEVATKISIQGQNASVAVGDAVYWMGDRQFYVYNGSVQQIPCTVKEYVFNDLNSYQSLKITAGSNAAFGEVWWFYPSKNSANNDKYVVYNYDQSIWYYGTIDRTAWADRGVVGFPIAAALDGHLYYQESGLNDGTTNPETPLNSYIESSGVEIGEGESYMFVNKIIPDLTFRNSSSSSPVVSLSLYGKNFPGGSVLQTDTKNVTSTAVIPLQLFTNEVFVRIRGRSISMKLESNQLNTAWRLGTPRIDIRPDGRR